ncbi:hypothetical protein HanRHA438_Chr13g0609451 [Helianthus annuus]|nr:hypothetical protein HanRHA438_Chr13g0609451 [Helianthus annuus]
MPPNGDTPLVDFGGVTPPYDNVVGRRHVDYNEGEWLGSFHFTFLEADIECQLPYRLDGYVSDALDG